MTDIELPLSHQFSLSGKLYRGKALGGLYGGIGRSVLFSGDPRSPRPKCEVEFGWRLGAIEISSG